MANFKNLAPAHAHPVKLFNETVVHGIGCSNCSPELHG